MIAATSALLGFADDGRGAALRVDERQRALVAAAAVEHVDRLVVAGEEERLRRQRVVARDLRERFPGAVVEAQDFLATVRRRLRGKAHVELGVGDEAGKAFVLLHHLALTGDDMVSPVVSTIPTSTSPRCGSSATT